MHQITSHQNASCIADYPSQFLGFCFPFGAFLRRPLRLCNPEFSLFAVQLPEDVRQPYRLGLLCSGWIVVHPEVSSLTTYRRRC